LKGLPEEWDNGIEVLIVGTGYAGLTAAIEAYDAGTGVLILEKMSFPGGNSVLSAGGANAVDPRRQIPYDIEDSIDLHFKHTFEGGDCVGDPEKIRFMVENSLEMCINWLSSIGVEWPDRVVRGYGALWERTHVPAKYKKYKSGAAITHALLDQVEKRGIPILLKHKVTEIIREKFLEGKVLGVEAETKGEILTFNASKALILASGGFAANLNMVIDHDRRLTETPTSNHIGSTGECIKIAEDIGAEVIGMDYIQCVPKIVKPPLKGKFFIISSKESMDKRNPYKIFINEEGNRFVREDGRRDEITYAALAQRSVKSVPIIKTDTIEELEKNLDISAGSLMKTIEEYNSYCDTKRDLDFNKHNITLIHCKTPPFQAYSAIPARHHTMGGLKVNGTTGQVVDRWGKNIPNFYAVGEVTAGIHGTNRVGFNAISDCIVFGRTIGKFVAS
jgi:succinate dehydrogenase/fumarate reductase flavoprotein subunit